jgi:hypothetical protein
MVFSNVLKVKSENIKELNKLNDYFNLLNEIIYECNSVKNNIFYHNSNSSTYLDDYKKQEVRAKNLSSYVREKLKKIQVFDIKDIIDKIEVNRQAELKIDLQFYEILQGLKDSCKKIYEHIGLSDEEKKKELVTFILYVETLLMRIDSYKETIRELITINKLIENTYEISENEEIFMIQLHDKNMSLKEIVSCIDILNNIYERACNMLEISSQDFQLKPIKLESGSWLEKVIGHEKIFNFIEDLLNRAIGFIYRNYTSEGKTKGQINKIDLMKEELKLIDLCEKHGIDTTKSKETFEGNLNAMCQDVLKLTSKSNKITVNDNTYDKEKELSEKVLEEYKRMAIETSEKIVLN